MRLGHRLWIGVFLCAAGLCGAQVREKVLADRSRIRSTTLAEGRLVEFFAPEGHLACRGMVRDSLREGLWVYLNGDSDTLLAENYAAGVLEGLQKKFTPSSKGTLVEEVTWRGGRKNGPSREYFKENGRMVQSLFYKDGLLEGNAVYFDENGIRSMEGDYCRGRRCGVWKFYEGGRFADQMVYEVAPDGSNVLRYE